jgi:hypothetical protein
MLLYRQMHHCLVSKQPETGQAPGYFVAIDND